MHQPQDNGHQTSSVNMLVQAPFQSGPTPDSSDGVQGPSTAPTVVIDWGSCTTKYGFSGDSAPSELLPIVGKRKHMPMCLLGATYPKQTYIGSEVHGKEHLLTIRRPISGTQITSWDDVEALWHHIYSSQLTIDPTEHPALITAPATGRTPKDNETLAILLFETFTVPSAFLASPALLSLLAAGRTTGLAIDSGHAHTTCVPVYNGFPLAHGTQTIPVGGRDITAHLAKFFADTTTNDESVLTDIKERVCRVAEDAYRDGGLEEGGREFFTLPDGRVVKVGREAVRAPEVLFVPVLGLAGTVGRVVGRVDLEVRGRLWDGVVLAGGNTLQTGFRERLRRDLDDVVPGGMKTNVMRVLEPRTAAWRGGSMLGGLSTFREMCVSYEEYDEYGPVLLRRKCLGVDI